MAILKLIYTLVLGLLIVITIYILPAFSAIKNILKLHYYTISNCLFLKQSSIYLQLYFNIILCIIE